MITTPSPWDEDASMSDWHQESLYGQAAVLARMRQVLAARPLPLPDVHTIDPATVPSAALRRIIAEVQHEKGRPAVAYDRFHHRHNRSAP